MAKRGEERCGIARKSPTNARLRTMAAFRQSGAPFVQLVRGPFTTLRRCFEQPAEKLAGITDRTKRGRIVCFDHFGTGVEVDQVVWSELELKPARVAVTELTANGEYDIARFEKLI